MLDRLGKRCLAADGCDNTGKFETRKKDKAETRRAQRKRCGFKSNEDGGESKMGEKESQQISPPLHKKRRAIPRSARNDGVALKLLQAAD
jgi:hypothetical protein